MVATGSNKKMSLLLHQRLLAELAQAHRNIIVPVPLTKKSEAKPG